MSPENTVAPHPVGTFLATLRAATAPMHAALEALPLSTALMQDNVTVGAYVAYLCRMRDVVRFCEQHVYPLVAEAVTDLPQRQKLHLLESDLVQLAPHLPATSGLYHPFATADVSFALGYLYVIEGSTLGGRVLLKHLGPKLHIDARHGGAFLTGYSQDTAANWKTFLHQFCTYVTEWGCRHQAVAGAQHAFASIAQHFYNKAK